MIVNRTSKQFSRPHYGCSKRQTENNTYSIMATLTIERARMFHPRTKCSHVFLHHVTRYVVLTTFQLAFDGKFKTDFSMILKGK